MAVARRAIRRVLRVKPDATSGAPADAVADSRSISGFRSRHFASWELRVGNWALAVGRLRIEGARDATNCWE
jgi:hypothetical protein